MKRSEMVQILSEALDNHTEIGMSCCNLGITVENLTKVLCELEKAGMLPPSIYLDFGGMKYLDNAWENEE